MKSKTGIVTRKCRLLCGQCRELRQVREADEVILLECGHSRTAEALPLAEGHISFESFQNLRRLSDVADKLFPLSRADEETSQRPFEDFLECR